MLHLKRLQNNPLQLETTRRTSKPEVSYFNYPVLAEIINTSMAQEDDQHISKSCPRQ
jgi:hypothetical protein